MKAIGKHVGVSGLIFAAALIMGGCENKQGVAVSTGDDPAAANFASAPSEPAPTPAPVSAQPTYSQPPSSAPAYSRPAYSQPGYSQPAYSQSGYSQSGYSQSAYSQSDSYSEIDSSDVIQASEPPPPLPQYQQPACPGENYIWTPGAWSYRSAGYFWVPGVWVMAPYIGALWTPPYWDYEQVHYRWHRGYWSQHIGFYGGIDYGYGYVGRGFYGGYWNHDSFAYNRAVTNVNVTVVHNVYNHTVIQNTVNRISYNGGNGGINLRPIPSELAVLRERPMPAVTAQVEHVRQAAENRAQFASVNHGRPPVAVAAQPLVTSYREPARERPIPTGAVRTIPENRPVQQPIARAPQNELRRAQRQEVRSAPAQASRAIPENRPAQQPIVRAPQNELRHAQRQETRPVAPPAMQQPVGRQEQPVQPRPVQQERPIQQHQVQRERSAPPQVQRQEVRPVPQQRQIRPEQPRPAQAPPPTQQERSARHQPAPPQEVRPVPQQENHPAPVARPAVQQPKPEAHPEPNKRPEEKRPEEKKK